MDKSRAILFLPINQEPQFFVLAPPKMAWCDISAHSIHTSSHDFGRPSSHSSHSHARSSTRRSGARSRTYRQQPQEAEEMQPTTLRALSLEVPVERLLQVIQNYIQRIQSNRSLTAQHAIKKNVGPVVPSCVSAIYMSIETFSVRQMAMVRVRDGPPMPDKDHSVRQHEFQHLWLEGDSWVEQHLTS